MSEMKKLFHDLEILAIKTLQEMDHHPEVTDVHSVHSVRKLETRKEILSIPRGWQEFLMKDRPRVNWEFKSEKELIDSLIGNFKEFLFQKGISFYRGGSTLGNREHYWNTVKNEDTNYFSNLEVNLYKYFR